MKTHLYILSVVCLLFSCSEKSDPLFDKEQFLKIYETGEFEAGYFPIDVKEIQSGYLILAERKSPGQTNRGIYLLKVDQTGSITDELTLDNQLGNPVAPFLTNGNTFSFFCMTLTDYTGVFVTVDFTSSPLAVSTQPITGITYPAAASNTTDGIILSSYDHLSRETVISRHNNDGSIRDIPFSVTIGAGEGVEGTVLAHFLRTGKRFPFSVGQIGPNRYFFNAFVNYTFSLSFTDLNSLTGVVQGNQDDAGISATCHLAGDEFSLARFTFGENYFLPKISIATNEIGSASLLGGFSYPELVDDAPVRIIKTEIATRSIIIYASNTRSDQIGLFFFDEASGAFLSSRYVGFTNPYEIGSMIRTTDGGLALTGTTYVAGRFARVSLIKISASDLESHVN